MENQPDDSGVLETTEEAVAEATEDTTEAEPELTKEELAELRGKAAKVDDLEKKNKQLFERAKKQAQVTAAVSPDGLSNKDVLFLAKADIHEDDLDDVLDWAKFKKISVPEAHKQMLDTLEVRAQQRKTADATSTGRAARGTSKTSGNEILARAERTGELPDSDEGMTALFQARLASRLPKKS